jgi:type VI protein secretion system component VasF
MGFFSRFAQRYLMLRSLAPMAERAFKPLMDGIKQQTHHLLIALALVAVGVACLVTGLAYFASSLWHALEPHLGMVGADLVLGVAYSAIAVVAIAVGLGRVRR